MPKKKKGGHARRAGKQRADESERPILFREAGQEYGQVLRVLGDMRFDVRCFDGKVRQCKVRGKMRKRVWTKIGDVVLVSLRDFQDAKADVIHKYTDNEVRNLRIYGEIPAHVIVGSVAPIAGGGGGSAGTTGTSGGEATDCVFDFDAI